MWELVADELIGLEVEVAESTDSGLVGLSGRVVDESMKTLLIQTERGLKRAPKACCVFIFRYRGRRVRVDGRLLVSRPEDRIKKALHLRRKWRLPGFFFK